jgi:MFS family permease
MNPKERISGKDLRISLRLVIIAASFGFPFATVTVGAAPALTGLTTSLGTSNIMYAVIMAMPVVGAIFQVFASLYIENTGRRKSLFLIAGLTHRLLWLPIALIPLMIDSNHNSIRVLLITLLIAISSAGSSICAITFSSWMGSLVPSEIKGRFFGKRTMIYTITSMFAALGSGILLDTLPGFPGFAVVFGIAAILGATDIFLFIWIKEPPIIPSENKLEFRKIIMEPFKNKNYMRYTMFVSLWFFSVNLAGPFFNRYMIQELHMNFLMITLFSQVIAASATILSIRLWGNLMDKYGSKPIMFICCCVVVLFPFSWLFVTPSNIWLILIINAGGGVFWPGFEMAAMNQSIWLSPEKNRSMYIAIYMLVVSLLGTAISFICGGILMEISNGIIGNNKIPFLMGQNLNSYHVLFIISGLMRLLVLKFSSKSYIEEDSQSPSQVLQDINSAIKNKLKI